MLHCVLYTTLCSIFLQGLRNPDRIQVFISSGYSSLSGGSTALPTGAFVGLPRYSSLSLCVCVCVCVCVHQAVCCVVHVHQKVTSK